MFNSKLNGRLESLERRHKDFVDHMLELVRAQEEDFRMLLSALNMEVRREEEFKIPRQIRPIPQPEAMTCCDTVAPPPAPAPAKRRRRKGGSK